MFTYLSNSRRQNQPPAGQNYLVNLQQRLQKVIAKDKVQCGEFGLKNAAVWSAKSTSRRRRISIEGQSFWGWPIEELLVIPCTAWRQCLSLVHYRTIYRGQSAPIQLAQSSFLEGLGVTRQLCPEEVSLNWCANLCLSINGEYAMFLTRHQTVDGSRWALDGHFLPTGLSLAGLLAMPQAVAHHLLQTLSLTTKAQGDHLAPIDPGQEVWGSGVTYLRSRAARMAESTTADVYSKVYDAERPEIFFKQLGWRVVGSGQPVRIRKDTRWNVPEPELTLVVNAFQEIVGYTVGNDMSSRDIEGENPLYLPQAKTYTGSCALGPGIVLATADEMRELTVQLSITRGSSPVFAGDTSISKMKRPLPELVAYLCRELEFPQGVFLMTGTGVVPGDDFTLHHGDVVRITIGAMMLENSVG
jgi:2-dehydro-3-deoxy-D-arabinonate dehydratase